MREKPHFPQSVNYYTFGKKSGGLPLGLKMTVICAQITAFLAGWLVGSSWLVCRFVGSRGYGKLRWRPAGSGQSLVRPPLKDTLIKVYYSRSHCAKLCGVFLSSKIVLLRTVPIDYLLPERSDYLPDDYDDARARLKIENCEKRGKQPSP